LRVAVVSPFLDRRHGTERCIVEQVERFAAQQGAEIHLYSQRVDDLANVVPYPDCSPGHIVWHRVPRIPGPHILGYIWWFVANHVRRRWDAKIHGVKYDLTYSPGINAIDADAISIHVVFEEFYRRNRAGLGFRNASIVRWPVILHRRLYYALIRMLERRIYPDKRTALTGISQHTADCAQRLFQRDDVIVVRYGVDTTAFSRSVRLERRISARAFFRIASNDFCLLLIGNDWKSKGLDALLKAMWACSEPKLRLLVVGTDDCRGYEEVVRKLNLDRQVQFCGSSSDVMQFYAAADAYVGPSLEDAYGLPILEAMACGLPVIVSTRAGASEIVRDGENGLLVRGPEDSGELAGLVRTLYADGALRERLGEKAVQTASRETWDRNAVETWEFLKVVREKKLRSMNQVG